MQLISGQTYKAADGRLIRVTKARWDSHFKGRSVIGDQPTGFYDDKGNSFDGTLERDTLLTHVEAPSNTTMQL